VLAFPFTTHKTPELVQVGGKAMSLILMTRQGFPVPPGFVLSVAFFQPWLEYVQSTPEWTRVLSSPPENLKENCDTLKTLCTRLELDDVQREVLAKALKPLRIDDKTLHLAVRSSSPEEDLEELSFAGGYETTLGVTEETLEDALRRSFASCFDERVFRYKEEHGLAVDKPRIAVIVQKQIAAETAGVAFSLNPINNCYDEAVINANFGLGESVVAGLVSPDSFTVDKVSRTILERKAGKKETSVWLGLDSDGGTYKEPSPSRSQLCLSDEDVLALTDMLVKVEDCYKKPIDIEWAFADGEAALLRHRLYLLQARPITAYFPLPEALITAPGEPKRLYGDLTLAKWGMKEPLSVMGTDYLAIANSEMLKATMGDIGPEVVSEVRPTLEGRTYVNVSFTLKLRGKKGLMDFWRPMDALGAETIASIDETEYTLKKLPPALKGLVFKMIRQNLGLIRGVLQALRNPTEFKGRYFEEEEQLRKALKAIEGEKEPFLAEFATRTMRRMVAYATVFGAGMAAAELARSRIKKLFKDEKPEIRDQVVYLGRALPNNITIEMGLAMYRLAGFKEIAECASGGSTLRRGPSTGSGQGSGQAGLTTGGSTGLTTGGSTGLTTGGSTGLTTGGSTGLTTGGSTGLTTGGSTGLTTGGSTELTTGEEFASRLKERSFSPEFLAAWDAFMEEYGFRGPMEMDVAAPRFYEQPTLFFEQLRTMAESTNAANNPQAIFDKARAQREKAYQDLLQVAQKKGKRKAKQFEKQYNILVELGGFRERPKYFVSLITDMFRRRALAAAQPLLGAGRLDSPEQVFDLHMDDLKRGLADPSLDLRALAEKNTRFPKKLRQVRELPRIVDSRGKILRPPQKEASEGELVGEPISPGVVRGKIKVLHEPDEKPVLPGEILVARATDPGWTPLFLNAGGIVLEVGGMLQHGALVAREYGKPCIAGIESATLILNDGQMVEMDGANGMIRFV
jgi:phosphoenolpyruvate synthase/pyruvate phosphate dikinase